MAIPVYVFTGFLDSGKTRFIQETLEDERFNAGEKTLLLVCEEGEEEYDPSSFAAPNVYIEVIEDPGGPGRGTAGEYAEEVPGRTRVCRTQRDADCQRFLCQTAEKLGGLSGDHVCRSCYISFV